MRQLQIVLVVALTLAIAACGDEGTDPNTSPETSESADADASDSASNATPPEDTTTDATGPSACEHPCLNEFDQSDKKLCPDPKSDWTCESGCCEPVFRCESDADCAAHGLEEGQCTDPAMGCACDLDTGVCASVPCASQDACPEDLACAAGACIEVDPDATFALRIVTNPTVLMPGASTGILVEAYWPDLVDLATEADVEWDSSHPDVVAIDADGVATGGTEEGEAVLTATHPDGGAASVTLRNVVPDDGATLTVALVTEGTANAVSGHYALVDATSGETIASGAIPASGVLSTTHSATAGVDVHVFAIGHDWVSHLGVTDATLLAPVAPTMWGYIAMDPDGELTEETELVGATVLQGAVDMGAYEKAGEVELTISALPFSSSLFDFNLESILGASVERFFHPDTAIPGIDTTETLEMPGGLTFAFGGPAIPSYVLAMPPGHSTIWTLGGRIGLDEVFAFSDDIFEAFDGGNINFGELASYLMPFFTEFWSGMADTPDLTLDGPDITTVDSLLRIPLGL
ncbi:MAG: hypothetical protein QF464_13330, partial [Myxococcota bacterium]|nr:hypothetical protein [Myxococcota bacterium]